MLFGIPAWELGALAVALLVTGFVTGILAGLFGVGGGAILVPALYELFRFLDVPEVVRIHLCVGTSLAIIIPTSVRSFLSHHRRGAVDTALLRQWAAPVVLGTLLGSLVTAWLPGTVLKLVFVMIATGTAVKLALGRDDWRLGSELPAGAFRPASGFGIGLLSAWMGIGGGAIANPLLTFYGMPIHRAVATTSGLGVLISIPGMIGYIIAGWPSMALLPPLSLGFVSVLGALLVVPTSFLSAPLGVALAHRLPKRRLEIAFACFLAFVSLRFVLNIAGLI